MLMGLRRGEVAALKWEDIADGVLTVRRMQRTVKHDGAPDTYQVVDKTKTDKSRRIAVTPRAQAVLDALKAVCPSDVWLFPADTPEGCVTNATIPLYLGRILRAAGIPVSHDLIRGSHAFRRNFSTDVVNVSGYDDKCEKNQPYFRHRKTPESL